MLALGPNPLEVIAGILLRYVRQSGSGYSNSRLGVELRPFRDRPGFSILSQFRRVLQFN